MSVKLPGQVFGKSGHGVASRASREKAGISTKRSGGQASAALTVQPDLLRPRPSSTPVRRRAAIAEELIEVPGPFSCCRAAARRGAVGQDVRLLHWPRAASTRSTTPSNRRLSTVAVQCRQYVDLLPVSNRTSARAAVVDNRPGKVFRASLLSFSAGQCRDEMYAGPMARQPRQVMPSSAVRGPGFFHS